MNEGFNEFTIHPKVYDDVFSPYFILSKITLGIVVGPKWGAKSNKIFFNEADVEASTKFDITVPSTYARIYKLFKGYLNDDA